MADLHDLERQAMPSPLLEDRSLDLRLAAAQVAPCPPQCSDETMWSSGRKSDIQTLVHSRHESTASLGSWRTGQQTPVSSSAKLDTLGMGGSTPMGQSSLSLSALIPKSVPQPPSKEWTEPADSIAIVGDRDDADTWRGWKRHLFRLVPLLILTNSLIYVLYLVYRILCIIWSQRRNNETYSAAWIFIGVEIAVAIPTLMHNSWTMLSMKKRRRPKLRLKGFEVPTVDVFITCCGEDDDVVLDTIRAACDLDYPYDQYRVIVLDDGKSAGLEASVTRMTADCPHLYYVAREKIPGQPHHFKAGNLNYGLDLVHRLPGGASQFMAALDADMIPEKDWLRAVLPHLLADPKMALACPPQLFYNTPLRTPLAQSLDFFVHVIEPIKDSLGVAWCTGSGYVARREALDDIGNFPLGSLAEDVATSTHMLGKGWKTAYVHEPLQFGTVPEDYGSHLKQRTRWAIGTVDTSFKLNFCLFGEKVRQMTIAQRFSGFLYATLSLYTIGLTISLFSIPIILLMGKRLVAYATDEQLRWLIRLCFAATMSNRISEYVLSVPAGYHTGQRSARYQLWMAPYIALCIVRSFMLPSWLGGTSQAFKPTGSLSSALNERDPLRKKNMVRRLWAILFNYMGFFHFMFVYMTLTGVALTSFRCYVTSSSVREVLMSLMTHAFWPPLTFVFICSSLWVPIAYAIDPPMMPDREDLLDRDVKTHVAHPTAESKKIAFGGQAAWFELELTTSTLFTALIFTLSFIF
ncbi:Glycosyl transferase, family 2 [Ophiocordyceps camponoti-floridani]|uniref:Glycosyl transferase, family 2 n=1 Tax=Ophiocordyceps camponoti-floridani TaxID=2030778 RepID=A0A8H4QAF1_9HYPO|nr:Glycosyl transferase, family 2 [Ophiocordyceps camponoti-floridani]